MGKKADAYWQIYDLTETIQVGDSTDTLVGYLEGIYAIVLAAMKETDEDMLADMSFNWIKDRMFHWVLDEMDLWADGDDEIPREVIKDLMRIFINTRAEQRSAKERGK